MLKFLLLLSCLNALDSYEIKTVSRWQVHLSANFNPTSDGRCYTSSDISGIAPQDKKKACQALCLTAGENCKAFIYDAPNCLFLNYMLLPAQPGDTGAVYYTDTYPGDIPVDIARNKVATGEVYNYPEFFTLVFYAPVTTVTQGHACVKAPRECWCSGMWQKTLKINLGKSYTVQKIRITPIPTLEAGVGAGETNVHVGNNGHTGDPLFGAVSTVPAPGTTVDVVGSATGQYIFMQKNSPFWDTPGLCLCFVEAFGY